MKERKKRALINFIAKEQLEEAIKNSTSTDGIIRYLGFVSTGNTRDKIKRKCKEFNIEYPNFPKSNKGRKFGFKYPIEYYAVKNGNKKHRRMILNQLVKRGIRPYKCELCGIEAVWNDKPLVLQLHHINGINNDNRLENVQILCPNCHSQSDSFRGRNKK